MSTLGSTHAIPYVAAQADDPAFATAGLLLLRGGQAEFTAQAAYDWLAGSARSGFASRGKISSPGAD